MQHLNKVNKIIAAILIIANLLLVTPRHTYAAASGSAVILGANISFQEVIAAAKSAVIAGATVADKYANLVVANKETFLDSIAYQISRMVIKQLRDGMIRWIQSGYNGSPSFMINPEQMLRNMAATQAKMVLNDVSNWASYSANSMSAALITDVRNNQINTEAAFQAAIQPTLGVSIQNNVCSAEGFGLMMQQKKWTDDQARAARKALCESGLDPNTQQSLLNTCFKNDFKCGGWAAWMDMSQNPERNTSIGQLNLATNRIKTQAQVKTDIATKEADRGNGFFNVKECIRWKNITVNGATDKICDEYQSTSPGQKAMAMMDEVVTDPIKQARLANEINESVSAVGSAFLSDLVSRGFKVINGAVNDLNISIAEGTNNINNKIAKQYANMDEAIKDFTKPNASTPAPAYNQTNLQVVNVDTSAAASLSRNMLKDMISVASSNESYIRIAKKEVALLSPYIDGLNNLSACYDSLGTSTDKATIIAAGRDYIEDRMTKSSGILPGLTQDIISLPPQLESLKKSIVFVANSNDVNALQAVYQSYNDALDTGKLKKSEDGTTQESKYTQLDMSISGAKDEAGNPVSSGDMGANLTPKLNECRCYQAKNYWVDGRCIGPYLDTRPTIDG